MQESYFFALGKVKTAPSLTDSFCNSANNISYDHITEPEVWALIRGQNNSHLCIDSTCVIKISKCCNNINNGINKMMLFVFL